MGEIIAFLYVVLGYLSLPHTIWKNKAFIYSDGLQFFITRIVWSIFLGWLTIPWWLLSRKK